eukprot:scaffold31532_cov78-Skeletonema_dohrnii-CCMP3373.AAC.3
MCTKSSGKVVFADKSIPQEMMMVIVAAVVIKGKRGRDKDNRGRGYGGYDYMVEATWRTKIQRRRI